MAEFVVECWGGVYVLIGTVDCLFGFVFFCPCVCPIGIGVGGGVVGLLCLGRGRGLLSRGGVHLLSQGGPCDCALFGALSLLCEVVGGYVLLSVVLLVGSVGFRFLFVCRGLLAGLFLLVALFSFALYRLFWVWVGGGSASIGMRMLCCHACGWRCGGSTYLRVVLLGSSAA